MKTSKRRGRLVAVAALAVVVAGCETAPITGRQQLILLPESQDAQLGLQAYQKILSEATLVSDNSDMSRRVETVGRRIAAVSGRDDFDWEFHVIEDETPNAFALPGGKVGVHTGLFKGVDNDDQLAAVMAHEVGHAIARHGSERISTQLLLQAGLAGLGIVAGTEGGNQYVQMAATAATLGIVLPFTRNQESEADEIGVILMAQAGYDPRQAVDLWRNFATLGGDRPPEFLSTHPSPGNRIQRVQGLLPRAMPIYERARSQGA